MSESKVSDRARLIRLIDGGPEALREAQEEREKLVASAPPLSIKEAPIPQPVKQAVTKVSKINSGALLRWIGVVVLILLATRLAIVTWHASEKPSTTASSLVSPPKIDRSQLADGDVDEAGMGLRLVGVDWSESPVALIEDLKTGKTYFAKKNDKIKGVRIKEIFKDHVAVFFQGQNEELR